MILAFARAGFVIAPILRHLDLPATVTLGLPSILLVTAAALAEAQDKVPRMVRSWSWLGDSSYAIYLFHMLVIWHVTD
jgi:peptidoglycan/LPS O-acetylase OafA/YrhL